MLRTPLLRQFSGGDTVKAKAGWYVDWEDPTKQRFFSGTLWTPDTVQRTVEATELPPGFKPHEARKAIAEARDDAPADGLKAAAALFYVLAVIGAIIVVIGGIALIVDRYFAAGVAVLAGGLVQALFIGVVARLCVIVSGHRSALAGLASRGSK
jgi:hypothetical protein